MTRTCLAPRAAFFAVRREVCGFRLPNSRALALVSGMTPLAGPFLLQRPPRFLAGGAPFRSRDVSDPAYLTGTIRRSAPQPTAQSTPQGAPSLWFVRVGSSVGSMRSHLQPSKRTGMPTCTSSILSDN